MEPLLIRMDDDLRSALKTAAAGKGLSEAELARRLLRRGLALEAGEDGAVVLSAVAGGVVRDIVAPIRQLAHRAAFEAQGGHLFGRQILGHILLRMGVPKPEIVKLVEE